MPSTPICSSSTTRICRPSFIRAHRWRPQSSPLPSARRCRAVTRSRHSLSGLRSPADVGLRYRPAITRAAGTSQRHAACWELPPRRHACWALTQPRQRTPSASRRRCPRAWLRICPRTPRTSMSAPAPAMACSPRSSLDRVSPLRQARWKARVAGRARWAMPPTPKLSWGTR